MVCFRPTDRLSSWEIEMKQDLSSLHLLADTASLVSKGQLDLDSSISDLDDEKTTTFGPARWMGRNKRSPRVRVRALTVHAQKRSLVAVDVACPKNKQDTCTGVADYCKKRARALDPTKILETGRVSKKARKMGLAALLGPRELPIQYMEKIGEMGGRDVTLVVEKTLTITDMRRSQSRLSLPKSHVRERFLSEEEIRILDEKHGINVSLIEPCLEVSHGFQLKKWKYRGKNFSYVLTEKWNGVAHPYHRNELIDDIIIQLWSFRVDGNLWFCLTKVEEAPVEGN